MRLRFLCLALVLVLSGCVEQAVKPDSQTSTPACACTSAELPPIQIPDADRYSAPAAKPGEAPKAKG